MLQSHYQVLRPLTTAHLAQTMSMLSLTAIELRQQIDGELSSNPALELLDERRCPTCHRLIPIKGACPVCSHPHQGAGDEPIVFVSPRDVFYGGTGTGENETPEDRYSSMVEELPVYVFRQIAPDIDPDDRRLAAYLLTNLDDDGLLTVPLVEAARYLHVLPSRLEKVKAIIQRADPIGVGSSSTEEALLVQLDVLSESHKIPQYAARIIHEGLGLLSRHQFAELARQLRAPLPKVQEAARFISENLNPFPGRSSWGYNRHTQAQSEGVYYQPDIIINRSNDHNNTQLMVEIIMPLFGTLRVNPLYKQALQEASGEQKEVLREDLDRAALFIKCLQQRNHTIQRLVQKVVMLQRDFILKGEKHLIPVTRAHLAHELDVHESTVSRAVANKAVQMPNGRIIPLSSFFDRSLNVRTILREMIAEEPYPLSDSELVDRLATRGIHIARRTVAKYRAMEGILPANLRHT